MASKELRSRNSHYFQFLRKVWLVVLLRWETDLEAH